MHVRIRSLRLLLPCTRSPALQRARSHRVGPPPNMPLRFCTRQAVQNFTAAQTAAIVEDYVERSTKDRQTRSREALRLLVVAILAMFLVTAVVLLMVVGVNPQRTVRIYVPEAVTKLKAQQLSFGNTTDETWLCPCQQSEQAFSNFLPLTLVANMTSGSNNTINIAATFNSTTSYNVPDVLQTDCGEYALQCLRRRGSPIVCVDQISQACQAMLAGTASVGGTSLSFPYLSRPQNVWQAAASHSQSAISPLVAYNTLLNDPDQSVGWWCIEDLLNVLSSTWFLVINSTETFATAEQFVAIVSTNLTPAHMPFNQVFSFPPYIDNNSFPAKSTLDPVNNQRLYLTPKVVPIITFDWDAYVDGCDVLYCDVTKRTSVPYRVFVGFSQIGGVLTIALVVVRMLVWPIVVCTLHLMEVKYSRFKTPTVSGVGSAALPQGSGAQFVQGPTSLSDHPTLYQAESL